MPQTILVDPDSLEVVKPIEGILPFTLLRGRGYLPPRGGEGDGVAFFPIVSGINPHDVYMLAGNPDGSYRPNSNNKVIAFLVQRGDYYETHILIDESLRRKGIGTQVYETLFQLAQEEGFKVRTHRWR